MSTCPLCAEVVEPGSTRCPHCGESFVLPPLPSPGSGPLPPALRLLAWALLLLAALHAAGFVQLVVFMAQYSMFDPWMLATVCLPRLGHLALMVAAGVGLLRARPWAPILAWLHVGLTILSFGWSLVTLFAMGRGPGSFGLDFSALVFLLGFGVTVGAVVVLVRSEVRAVFRKEQV